MTLCRLTALALAGAALAGPARAESAFRSAMIETDIPTATGVPDHGFEGVRFLGYPIFEGLVRWDPTGTDRLAGLKPALAESWEQDPAGKRV